MIDSIVVFCKQSWTTIKYLDLVRSSLYSALDSNYLLDHLIGDHSLVTLMQRNYHLDFAHET